MALLYRVRTLLAGTAAVGGGMNILHFAAAGGSAANAATAAATFWTDLQSAMVPNVSWALDPQIDVIESTTNKLTAVDTGPATSGAGVATGEPCPFATQGRINWFTGNVVNFRQLKGKTFVPGPSETQNNGAPLSTYITDLNAAAAALIANVNSQLVVYSVTHKLFFDTLDGLAWNKWAILRSRRD